MSSTIKLLPLTFLIASKPAPVNDASERVGPAISSDPPREQQTRQPDLWWPQFHAGRLCEAR